MLKIIIYRLLLNIWGMLVSFVHTIPVSILCGIITYYVIKKKHPYLDTCKKKSIIFLAMYMAIMIQIAILFREYGSIFEIDLIPFDRYGGFRYIILYGIANILIFIPVGVLVPLIFDKIIGWRKICIIGLSASLCIELGQLILQCGVCQTEDLIMNTIGTLVGYKVLKISKKR